MNFQSVFNYRSIKTPILAICKDSTPNEFACYSCVKSKGTKMDILIAGVDEAGRGPLAGPVVAAAVILDPKKPIQGLTDSKKLSEKMREKLYSEIMNNALASAIGFSDVQEIDNINILQATLLAMARAVDGLLIKPTEVWIDGNQTPKISYPSKTIISGDLLEPCISAASIIAKVTRDRVMLDYDRKYPQYGFSAHKGYGTAIHLEALQKYGASPIHRQSFAPVKKALIEKEA